MKHTTTSSLTIRQCLEYRPGISEWFATTQELFNRIAAFYFDVIHAHPEVLVLSAKKALTELERLTHATTRNPDPPMPLSDVAENIPAVFRRAAIHAALGAARSFFTNLHRWETKRAKALETGKPFHRRPPVPPRRWNRSVVFYVGLWKDRTNGRITLKLWDGQTWRWVRFRVTGREILPGWEIGSPHVVRRGRHWWLHLPITTALPLPEKADIQITTCPDVRVCAVDLNINDALAVCRIQTADGTVLASRFIRGGRELHGRRKSLLGRIARNRARTGIIAEDEQDNVDLWTKIRHVDTDIAHRVSRRIVEFAQLHGTTIIVFEHLGHFRPEKGRYSRRGNAKRTYWLRGRIVRYARYKAWLQGLLTCRVNPKHTSRACARCHAPVARYGEGEPPAGYREGAPLVFCAACQKQWNADWNATGNIGQRLFARYRHQEKPLARSLVNRSAKAEGGGVSYTTVRPGDTIGHGTAPVIPCPVRPQRGSSHAASTPRPVYAGVAQEAAAL